MSANPLKVLLVEDNPGDARLIREMLGGAMPGFVLEHVSRLCDALERLVRRPQEQEFALVLLDLSLGETEGLETFRTVRERVPAIPIVVFTGQDDETLAAESLQAGAQDYLVKGRVNSDMLARSLRYAVERGKVEEQLRQHAAELAESGRRKDEFLAILSHELRNPLSPLAMAAELLGREEMTGEDRQWCRDVITRQVRTLTRLVDDLLDVSRISRGKLALRTEALDLLEAVGRAAEATRHLFEERQQEFAVELPPAPLWVLGDAVRLEQVICNLLTNAGKYTPPRGKIRIIGAAEGAHAVIRVRDTGVGIPAEMLDRVFELFIQVDPSLSRMSQWGMGIGLALVRSLVELHGGTVSASSPGAGGGSEFCIRIPLLAEPLAKNAHDSGDSGRTEPVSVEARRILVVEDQEDAASSLARLLRLWGHHVKLAHCGHEALAVAEGFRPEAAIVDIGMPEMDGYEVARCLRLKPHCRATVLVAMTGYGRDEDRRRAADAGFNFHMTKPVDLDSLRLLLASPKWPPQPGPAPV
jgi:signal transduction histidine kinase